MPTTLIFDLDDTLYDEIDYCRSGFAAVAEYLSRKISAGDSFAVFNALWQEFTEGDRSRVFDKALSKLDLLPKNGCDEFIRSLVQVYRNHRPDIKLPPDSGKILQKLNGRYHLAMLTDGFLPSQRLKVEALGIERYFEIVIYTEELGRENWKPSTAGFEKIIEYLGQPAGQMAYIADNEAKDFIAPNKLGMTSIKITRPAGIHRGGWDHPQARPKYHITNISELPALLAKVNQSTENTG